MDRFRQVTHLPWPKHRCVLPLRFPFVTLIPNATAEKPIQVDGPAVSLEVYESKRSSPPRWVLRSEHIKATRCRTAQVAAPRLVETNRGSGRGPDFATNDAHHMSRHYAQGKEGMYWLKFRLKRMRARLTMFTGSMSH